jgi:hypothetical protein
MSYIRSCIRSIQRGTIVIGSGTVTNTATISAVNTASAVVRMVGAHIDNGGSGDGFAYLVLTNSTTITATRTTGNGNLTVEYVVV